MPKILDYLILSSTAVAIQDLYTTPTDFVISYNSISDNEIDAFLKHYIVNNPAYIFKTKPLLYEQIVKYIAAELGVNDNEIKLIGSAKTGFSISPPPKFGKPFQNSDLDFTIVSDLLFNKLSSEFHELAKRNNGEENYLQLRPKNNEYWKENILHIPKTINRGFIDTYKLPNISLTPVASHIAEILYRLQQKLKDIHLINVKQPSLRVYKDWASFMQVLKNNTKLVLDKVPIKDLT